MTLVVHPEVVVVDMNPELQVFIDRITGIEVPSDRKEVLLPLINYINEKRTSAEEVNLLFVCTHNSRRSHLAQIWAKVASVYFEKPIQSYSGGVEVTALNERVVNELRDEGFQVTGQPEENSHYKISFDNRSEPIVAWSKLYDDGSIKADKFAAIMTCSDADENCPYIPGSEKRIPVRYRDPKEFDGTDSEKLKYKECSEQIASEMFYVFSQVK